MPQFFPVPYVNRFFSERSTEPEQSEPPAGGVERLKKVILKIPIMRSIALCIWKLVRKCDLM
jgi:hypothetical protein